MAKRSNFKSRGITDKLICLSVLILCLWGVMAKMFRGVPWWKILSERISSFFEEIAEAIGATNPNIVLFVAVVVFVLIAAVVTISWTVARFKAIEARQRTLKDDKLN